MKRKWLLGIGRALLALALTSVLLVLTVSLLLSLLTAREERSLLGLRAMIVRSDSMSATDFAAGDLILSVAVDPEEIREGDVITFRSPDPEQGGATVTHKVRTVLVDANGKRSFVTYGTTTGEADRLPVLDPSSVPCARSSSASALLPRAPSDAEGEGGEMA